MTASGRRALRQKIKKNELKEREREREREKKTNLKRGREREREKKIRLKAGIKKMSASFVHVHTNITTNLYSAKKVSKLITMDAGRRTW